MKRKFIKPIAIGAVLVAIAFVTYKKLHKPVVNVPIIETEFRDNLTIYTQAQGEIHPAQEAFLPVNKAGTLESIFVHLGDSVHANQIVAIVDETASKAALKSALSEFKLASAEYARVRRLVASDSATTQELDEASSKVAVKRSALEQARQKLEDGIVRSSIDGVVRLLPFHVGDYIPSGSRVAGIEDDSSYKVVATLPISFVDLMPAHLTFQIAKFNPLMMNQTDFVTIEGDIAKQSDPVGVEKKDVEVGIRIAAIPNGLVSRDSVRIRIPVKEYKNVTLVDARALFHKGNEKKLVLLGSDGHLQWFNPEFGFPSDDRETVLNLPKDAKVIVPEVKDLEKIVNDKLAVKEQRQL